MYLKLVLYHKLVFLFMVRMTITHCILAYPVFDNPVLPGVKFIGPPKMDGLPSKTIIDHEHNQLFQSPISRVYVIQSIQFCVVYIYRRPELTTLFFVHCLIFCLISGLPLFKSDQPLFLNPGLRIYLQYSPVFGWQSQNINNNIIPA